MQLEQLYEAFIKEIEVAHSREEIRRLKAKYIGRAGSLNTILKGLKSLPPEERRKTGQAANQYKHRMQAVIKEKNEQMSRAEQDASPPWQDITLTRSRMAGTQRTAGFHPVTLVQRELEDIFTSMGYEILDGPHIEDDYHNFEALNFPPGHPAREMQDTFWFKDGSHLLRTHTSCIQIRGMVGKEPPFRFVGPGKVFRAEATDASHEMAFHQMEGMMVDRGLSVANLIYFMKVLLKEIFRKEVRIRLRPGYFPFVEPGFELDISCLICAGEGCAVCKKTGWVELLPCGMVHPNVLTYGGIDPDLFSGFAFGLGLDRLVMMRYGIDDIRLIHGGDLAFVSQFAAY